MDPKPLPAKLPSEIITLSSNIAAAYPNILRLEKSSDLKNVMYARILGYMLLYRPSDEAWTTVTKGVVSCANEDQLAEHGKYYYDYYIRPCKLFHVLLVAILTVIQQSKGSKNIHFLHPPILRSSSRS